MNRDFYIEDFTARHARLLKRIVGPTKIDLGEAINSSTEITNDLETFIIDYNYRCAIPHLEAHFSTVMDKVCAVLPMDRKILFIVDEIHPIKKRLNERISPYSVDNPDRVQYLIGLNAQTIASLCDGDRDVLVVAQISTTQMLRMNFLGKVFKELIVCHQLDAQRNLPYSHHLWTRENRAGASIVYPRILNAVEQHPNKTKYIGDGVLSLIGCYSGFLK